MAEPIVEIKQGKLKGRIVNDYKGEKYFSFQGIPYAKPPIGNLRFKSPLPPEKWSGILDATKKGNESLSKHFIRRHEIIGSENCLYLNVYTSQLFSNANNHNLKPVMFWIHGGGFLYGSGDTNLYGPDYLITEDIVLVTINYRLGILGFLSLEDSSLNVPGNAGLKDMVQALKWVQENIIVFGGDPKNVTIFGESSGGAACHLLILSPMAKGLFHKAILQSGCAINPWVYGSHIGRQIAKVLDFQSNNEKDILEYLRSIDEMKFMEAQDKIKDHLKCNKLRPIGFVIEKPSKSEPNFLTENPMKIIESGNYNKVPIIIGYTNREGMISEIDQLKSFGSIQVDKLQDLENCVPWYYNVEKGSDLSKEIASKINEFYFQNKKISEKNVDNYFGLLETDNLFWRGIYLTIQKHLKNSDTMYLYRFSLDTDLNLFKKINNLQNPGAAHCDDLGYLFTSDYISTATPNSNEEIAMKNVIKLWTNFAKYNDPNKNLSINWNSVNDNSFICLDIGNKLLTTTDPDIERMEFWNNVESNLLIKLF